jgi:hypothetical protein
VTITSSGFAGGSFRVRADNLDLGRTYRLTRSTTLADGFTTVVEGPRPPTATFDTFTDPAPVPGKAFYRIEQDP